MIRHSLPQVFRNDFSPCPLAAFEIHRTLEDLEANPRQSRFRLFHHVYEVAGVAGMLRHAAANAARSLGLAEDWVDAHVLGHGRGKSGQATTDERLIFLPLPKITTAGVTHIRWAVLISWSGWRDFNLLSRRLNGAELYDERSGKAVAVLSQLPLSDRHIYNPFLAPSKVWTTVTPVILPGHDDPGRLRQRLRRRVTARPTTVDEQNRLRKRLQKRVILLLRKAFEQAGWSAELLAGALLEYRSVGWLAGLEVASKYRLSKVHFPRYHVRVRFRSEIRGPLVVGAGRYRGLGLFAHCS